MDDEPDADRGVARLGRLRVADDRAREHDPLDGAVHAARKPVKKSPREQQLSNALKQAQDLAVKAIEGPSHTGSFEALKEIALKQAGGIAASKK